MKNVILDDPSLGAIRGDIEELEEHRLILLSLNKIILKHESLEILMISFNVLSRKSRPYSLFIKNTTETQSVDKDKTK